MMLDLWPQLAADLEAVERRLEKETANYIQTLSGPWERYFLPALVMLSGRFYGYRGERLVSLAAVLQLIFTASFVHAKANRDAARPTLWGDYLYAKFFELLCRDGNLEFLEPLAEMIGNLHLNFIACLAEKKEAPDAQAGFIEGCGLLGGNAARLGGTVGGARPQEARVWYELGRALGIIWGMRIMEREMPIMQQVEAVKAALKRLPASSGRDSLENMLWALAKPERAQQLAT
ncbi:MAG: hypothetical protein ACPL5F_03435 [Moorellaceae bacterium]